MTTITITCTELQAECITRSLELYARLGLGQFEEIGYLCKTGQIRGRHGECTDQECDMIEIYCEQIKAVLCHPPNGSFGIGNHGLHEMTQRAYEIKKQIDKAVSEHRNPNPEFRGVNYDGRLIAYTKDPEITIKVTA